MLYQCKYLHCDSFLVGNDILLNYNEPMCLMYFILLNVHSYILPSIICLLNSKHQLGFYIICHYVDSGDIFLKMLYIRNNNLDSLMLLTCWYWVLKPSHLIKAMIYVLIYHYIISNNLVASKFLNTDMISIMLLINFLMSII